LDDDIELELELELEIELVFGGLELVAFFFSRPAFIESDDECRTEIFGGLPLSTMI